jgi:ribosomal protein L11 methyltransferase
MGRRFAPFEIGDRIRVVPEGFAPSNDGRIDIVMAPGAFGSGEHETTASCLDFLSRLPSLDGWRILDLGSGTAILAIAALKLGAARAVCVDTDRRAIRTGRLNCRLNGVGRKVEHLCGDAEQVPGAGFDAVAANLYADILLASAEKVVALANRGATILLSGIAYEYDFDVCTRYRRLGCRVIEKQMLEEFTTVLLRNSP